MTTSEKDKAIKVAKGVLKRYAGDFQREEAVIELAAEIGTTKPAAKCLMNAALTVEGMPIAAANFSARVDSETWYAMYDLIRRGYASTQWGVIQRAVRAEHKLVLRLMSEGQDDEANCSEQVEHASDTGASSKERGVTRERVQA